MQTNTPTKIQSRLETLCPEWASRWQPVENLLQQGDATSRHHAAKLIEELMAHLNE